MEAPAGSVGGKGARAEAPRSADPAALGPGPRGPAELGPAELAALLRFHRATGGKRDRDALVAAVFEALAGVVPVDRVALLLSESPSGRPELHAADAATQSGDEDVEPGSALDQVLRRPEPWRIVGLEQVRSAFPQLHDDLARRGMGSLLALPLVARGRCLGALAFLARDEGAWDRGAQALLEEISASVAVTLEGCLDYEHLQRTSRELAAIDEVNRAAGRHLHRDELFGALARSLRAVVPTERFGIELPIEGDRLQGHLLTPRGAEAEPTQPSVLPAPGTACDWVLRHRKWIVSASREELRERFPVTFEVMETEGMESLCALPLETDGRCRGVLFFMTAARSAYERLPQSLLEQVASAVAVALDDCLAHEELRRLRDKLAEENVYLREEIEQEHHFGEILGHAPALRQALALVEQVAATSSTVLILGETGTGKELLARALHERSPRRERPLVKVNCSAFSPGLIESELFGHVRGAFTGATADRKGRFELADGGTIFLDEIGELAPETQVKLLRVLQEREFEPVGSSATRRVDVRVIAATNRDLERAVAEGRFRADLFFRLNVLPIRMPALRERREDVPLLVRAFADRSARAIGKRIESVARETLERLVAYDWPGNVRELQNVIERAVILAQGPVLRIPPDLLPAPARAEPAGDLRGDDVEGDAPTALDEVTRQHVRQVLERCDWVIDGPEGAARHLGLRPSTLRSRMKKLGLSRPRPESA